MSLGLEVGRVAYQQQQAKVENRGEQQEWACRVECHGHSTLPRQRRQCAQADQGEQHLVVGLELGLGSRLGTWLGVGFGVRVRVRVGAGVGVGVRHLVRVGLESAVGLG